MLQTVNYFTVIFTEAKDVFQWYSEAKISLGRGQLYNIFMSGAESCIICSNRGSCCILFPELIKTLSPKNRQDISANPTW